MFERKLKMVKRLAAIALCLVLFLSALTVCASAIEKTDGVFVYDEADVIPAETENDINSRAKALYALTGSELATVTIKSFGGKDRNTLAGEIFTELKLSAEKNNGVLVLLVIDDDDYYVLPGSALTDKLNSDVLGEVFTASLEPDFAAKNYAEGAKKTFDDLLSRIEKIYSVDISTYDPSAAPVSPAETTTEEKSGFSIGKFFKWFFIIVLIIAGVLAAIAAVAFFKRPRYVSNGQNRRRHYNTERGAYVGMPERNDIERARRREAMMRNANAPQRAQGQRPYPQGQRPYPQGQRPQGQRPYPQGQRAQYPQGQRPANAQGQQMRRARPVEHEHSTAYPEIAPYVNRNDAPSGGARNERS